MLSHARNKALSALGRLADQGLGSADTYHGRPTQAPSPTFPFAAPLLSLTQSTVLKWPPDTLRGRPTTVAVARPAPPVARPACPLPFAVHPRKVARPAQEAGRPAAKVGRPSYMAARPPDPSIYKYSPSLPLFNAQHNSLLSLSKFPCVVVGLAPCLAK